MTPTYVTSVPQTQVVAAVQYSPTLFDVRANLATALQLTFEASGKGARLIVLPELAIGGAVMNSVDEAVAVCQEADGYQTSAFLPLAQQFNCHIVFGYVEVNEGKLYNSAAVVGPMGLVANARKHNLYGSDQLWAQPAEDPAPVVITPAGRLGVLICRDVSNKFRESYAFYDPMHRFYKRGSGELPSVFLIAHGWNW